MKKTKKIVRKSENIRLNRFNYDRIDELPNRIRQTVNDHFEIDRDYNDLNIISCECTICINYTRLETDYEYDTRLKIESNRKETEEKDKITDELKNKGIFSLNSLSLTELKLVLKERKANEQY